MYSLIYKLSFSLLVIVWYKFTQATVQPMFIFKEKSLNWGFPHGLNVKGSFELYFETQGCTMKCDAPVPGTPRHWCRQGCVCLCLLVFFFVFFSKINNSSLILLTMSSRFFSVHHSARPLWTPIICSVTNDSGVTAYFIIEPPWCLGVQLWVYSVNNVHTVLECSGVEVLAWLGFCLQCSREPVSQSAWGWVPQGDSS